MLDTSVVMPYVVVQEAAEALLPHDSDGYLDGLCVEAEKAVTPLGAVKLDVLSKTPSEECGDYQLSSCSSLKFSTLKGVDGVVLYLHGTAEGAALVCEDVVVSSQGLQCETTFNLLSCEGIEACISDTKEECDVPVTAFAADEGSVSLEERLARRNALLPPRQVRRVAPRFSFECLSCHKTFPVRSQLRRHQEAARARGAVSGCAAGAGAREFVCEVCKAEFPRALMLQDHLSFIHDRKRPFSCTQCDRKFYRPHDLKVHLNIHFDIKSYVCDTCGRQFNHLSNLKRHQRIHTGICPYVCEICKQRFRQVISLKQHMKDHGNRLKILNNAKRKCRKSYCQVCGKTFDTKLKRDFHERKVHSQNTLECKSCSKLFKSLDLLKFHSCSRSSLNRKRSKSRSVSERWMPTVQHSTVTVTGSNAGQNMGPSTPLCKEIAETELCQPVSQRLPQTEETIGNTNLQSEGTPADTLGAVSCPRFGNPNSVENNPQSVSPSGSTATTAFDTLVMYLTQTGDPLAYVTKKERPKTDEVAPGSGCTSTLTFALGGGTLVEDKTILIDVNDKQVDYLLKEIGNDKGYCVSDDGNRGGAASSNGTDKAETITIKEEDIEEGHDMLNDGLSHSERISLINDVCVHTIISDHLNNNCNEMLTKDFFENSGPNSNVRAHLSPKKKRRKSKLKFRDSEATSGITNPSKNNVSVSTKHRIIRRQISKQGKVKRRVNHSNKNACLYNVSNSKSYGIATSNNGTKLCEGVTTAVSGTSRMTKPTIKTEDSDGDSLIDMVEEVSGLLGPSASDPSIAESGGRVFRCSECGKEFNRRWNYQQHYATHFPSLHRYHCDRCAKTFAYRSTYTTHLAACHCEDGAVVRYPCQQCDKILASSGSLRSHVRRVHQRLRPHLCTLCSRAFGTRSELAYHTRLHRKEQPYVCSACGHTFAHSSNLHRHERLHTGERPHKCPYCPQAFIQAIGLTLHLKKHQQKPGSQPKRKPRHTRKDAAAAASSSSLQQSAATVATSTFVIDAIPTSLNSSGCSSNTNMILTTTTTTATCSGFSDSVAVAPYDSASLASCYFDLCDLLRPVQGQVHELPHDGDSTLITILENAAGGVDDDAIVFGDEEGVIMNAGDGAYGNGGGKGFVVIGGDDDGSVSCQQPTTLIVQSESDRGSQDVSASLLSVGDVFNIIFTP